MNIPLLIMALFIAFAVGLLLAWLFSRKKITQSEKLLLEIQTELAVKSSEIENQKQSAEEKITLIRADLENYRNQLQEERKRYDEAALMSERLAENNRNLNEKLLTQKTDIENLQQKFITEFENLSSKLLKQNSSEFTEVNQKNISEILKPLREKLSEFEKTVSETYVKGLKDQTDLRAEIKMLQEMNTKISEEAHNLTRALKGDVKKQGNWGEIMLERILERSGLRKGNEYDLQVSSNNEEGKRVIPDAIVYLPGNKHIIIDSKVSLLAYEHYVNETDDEKRKSYAAEHILSLKTHIKVLSEKHYQQLAELHTPDFVLMFIPLESSFGLAIQSDHEIFNYAWDNKIVMVSPSTLFATMLTIASIWKQENQARNAKEIAEQTARLYDKFTAFINDLEKIGNSINGLQNIYNDVFSKLSTGKGNLINRIEKIKKLGLSTSKSLNVKYIEEQNENETEDDEKLQ